MARTMACTHLAEVGNAKVLVRQAGVGWPGDLDFNHTFVSELVTLSLEILQYLHTHVQAECALVRCTEESGHVDRGQRARWSGDHGAV